MVCTKAYAVIGRIRPKTAIQVFPTISRKRKDITSSFHWNSDDGTLVHSRQLHTTRGSTELILAKEMYCTSLLVHRRCQCNMLNPSLHCGYYRICLEAWLDGYHHHHPNQQYCTYLVQKISYNLVRARRTISCKMTVNKGEENKRVMASPKGK